MGSYSYRHFAGKAYQFSDTANSKTERDQMLKKYRKKYRMVRAVATDVIRGKPSSWGIYIHIPSMRR